MRPPFGSTKRRDPDRRTPGNCREYNEIDRFERRTFPDDAGFACAFGEGLIGREEGPTPPAGNRRAFVSRGYRGAPEPYLTLQPYDFVCFTETICPARYC